MAIPPIPPGPDLVARATANRVQALVNGGFGEEALPTGFPWNRALLDVRIGRAMGQTYGGAINPASLLPAAVWAAPLATQVFHVDTVNGSDTTGTGIGNYFGDFSSSPVRTLSKAIILANATTIASRILINGAGNPTLNRASVGSATFPTVPLAIEALGGRVTLAGTDAHTWALNGTYTNCYSATETNASGAIDLLNQRWLGEAQGARLLDRKGVGRQSYVEFAVYATPAALSAATLSGTTGGGYCNSGGVTYVRRADGAAVTDVNTRVFRGSSAGGAPGFTTGTTLSNNSLYMAGFDFHNGFASSGSGTRNIWLHDCRAMYTTMDPGVGGNGFQFDAVGQALYTDCESWCCGSDSFNVHGVNGPFAQSMTVNCLGWDTGRGGSTSCNGLTGHEKTVSIDINGDFQMTRGGMSRFIDQSRCFMFGTRLLIDLGDGAATAPVLPSTVQADTNAAIWAWYCTINSTLYAYVTASSATARIYTRGNTVINGSTFGTGQVVPV